MTEENDDIRWQQRFSNFSKAFRQLEKYVGQKEMNELEQQGLIKSFEYTNELAWKTLQDFLRLRTLLGRNQSSNSVFRMDTCPMVKHGSGCTIVEILPATLTIRKLLKKLLRA